MLWSGVGLPEDAVREIVVGYTRMGYQRVSS